MIAIVGIPGSVHHTWRAFRSRPAARRWMDRTWREIMNDNPVLGSLPSEIISNRTALKRRWRDGSRIYAQDQEE